jgi:hypothetical protein
MYVWWLRSSFGKPFIYLFIDWWSVAPLVQSQAALLAYAVCRGPAWGAEDSTLRWGSHIELDCRLFFLAR